MQNITMKVVKNKLVIEIDLTKEFGLSKSGKSISVGSTLGNKSVPGMDDLKIGINCYKPVKACVTQ